MRTRIYILALLSWFAVIPFAKAQSYSGKAYATGNFIFCGKELPKNFSYLVEKKSEKGDWISVAELKAPVNLSECRARLSLLPKVVASVSAFDSETADFIWEKIKKSSATLDSLYAHSGDPRFQYTVGVGWFDDGLKTPGTYQYRISRLSKSGGRTPIGETKVVFPAKPFEAEAIPLRYKINLGNIEISYDMTDIKNTVGLKLYRSIYQKTAFKEIGVKTLFTNEKGKMVAVLNDDDVKTGLTYSYVAVPYDGLGNMGKRAETVNVYFVTKQADVGLITQFTVTPQPEKGGNLLKWDYNQAGFVSSVEVYRSTSYEKDYRRVVSLPSTQKEYFDEENLAPSIAYYYYLVLNNGQGNSMPSTRVPAILQGKRENFIPPQDLSLTRNGNVVKLQFRRVGYDVRGYYVYRANGYSSELHQLPRMIHSTDSLVVYTDTLPLSNRSSVYSYAVASINTSYNISPVSNRVNTVFSGGQLPVPDKLNAMLENDEVRLVWNDVSGLNSALSAYEVYRKTVNNENETEPEKLLETVNFMTNSIKDNTVLPGKKYIYRVRSIGADAGDASSFSLPYSIYMPTSGLLPPGEVSAIASSQKVTLKWTLPLSEDIESVLLYRAAENEKATLLKTLDAKAESYDDASVKKGTIYYYFVVIKYKNGLESKPTDSVSAKV